MGVPKPFRSDKSISIIDISVKHLEIKIVTPKRHHCLLISRTFQYVDNCGKLKEMAAVVMKVMSNKANMVSRWRNVACDIQGQHGQQHMVNKANMVNMVSIWRKVADMFDVNIATWSKDGQV